MAIIRDPHFILPTEIPYPEQASIDEMGELKEEVKKVLVATMTAEPSALLRLIDVVSRLGLAHHFRQEIHESSTILGSYVSSDLHQTSLQFRVLRQNGFHMTHEVFDKFTDANGKFSDHISEDVTTLLSLYEASYLGFRGEQVMEEAKAFSSKHLRLLLDQKELSKDIKFQIQESLQVPLHWRLPRVEARNFINTYGQVVDKEHPVLLHLAKLEYNFMRSVYMEELKEVTMWWMEVKSKNTLETARDNLVVECFFWAMGCIPEPELSKGRKRLAEFCCIVIIIDDIYDGFGSFDDLQKFTSATKQWDIKATEGLPDYMKFFYSIMVENAEQTARDTLDHDLINLDPLSYVKDQWSTYIEAPLMEAKWLKESYLPSFDEYMPVARISVAIGVGLLYSFLARAGPVAQHLPGCLHNWAQSDIFLLPAQIGRLLDDLTLSEEEVERGEPNAVQCYMGQHNVSEEEAQERIRDLISESWAQLNELGTLGLKPGPLINASMSMVRSCYMVYHQGDWFIPHTQDNQESEIQKYLFSSID